MNKLPVIETVIESFKFPITRLGPLLKRTLVSVALLIGATVLFTLTFADGLIDVSEDGLRGSALSIFGVAFLVMFASILMLLNGAIQVALRDPMGNRWFSFGGRELRYLLFFPLAIVIYLALGAIGAVLFFIGNTLSGAGLTGEGALGGLGIWLAAPVCFILFVFIGIRLMPLYGFIAIENRFDVAGAWRASYRNFWRILVVLFVVAIAQSVLLVLGSLIAGLITPIPETALDASGAAGDLEPAALAMMLLAAGAIQLPIFLYTSFASLGLYGFIYKYLATKPLTEPDVPQASETA